MISKKANMTVLIDKWQRNIVLWQRNSVNKQAQEDIMGCIIGLEGRRNTRKINGKRLIRDNTVCLKHFDIQYVYSII